MRKSISTAFFSMVSTLMVLGIVLMGLVLALNLVASGVRAVAMHRHGN